MSRFIIHAILFLFLLADFIFGCGLLGHITAAINASNAWGTWDAILCFSAVAAGMALCGLFLHVLWTDLPQQWEWVEMERLAVEEERRAERRRKLRA